ncbi:hypothetical protein HBI56_230910 [Parastagonospora nodorum]|uniref:Uncharacterized protein n=1 Tax=Phaeosphaeria nodorum (strain SN15 / ATCC MYA-4574 / FGSC 10173) TaxID=321614 RepID=A0A7U2FFK0_PHANO|nr:hypothetical protein HBH56_223850 [Parastagonospora nodorum]QRD04334.1 hypothetical protein JI435_420980 [Parastagonospora nodorum SN15]KAH3921920.1 hypothetical protein HBH54_232000 [Parastagonospora nodorum]KAH3939466.1 hypothetical protein HBH53_234800 [Parastagonospora nodorum]KAH3957182.1 hypothetical protein HBH51_228170 [Parastagonospora nodorum]
MICALVGRSEHGWDHFDNLPVSSETMHKVSQRLVWILVWIHHTGSTLWDRIAAACGSGVAFRLCICKPFILMSYLQPSLRHSCIIHEPRSPFTLSTTLQVIAYSSFFQSHLVTS